MHPDRLPPILNGMTKVQRFPLATTSAGHAPLRRPGSIRRTTSIDAEWPDGPGQNFILTGLARDIVTPADGGAPTELATGSFRLTISPKREIVAIETVPSHPRAAEMVGVRAGGASREALARRLGDIRGTPLFQLIDDFAGASLVAGWALSRWMTPEQAFNVGKMKGTRDMTAVCTGFTPGSQAMDETGHPRFDVQSMTIVVPLENPEDPEGWHQMPPMRGVRFRRARRIDIWREGGVLKVDAGFQDSATNPGGERSAIHEYRVHAEVDPATGELVAMQALPLILPYAECPGASIKASRMVGRNLGQFREAVPEVLRATLGCTHLNDVLRALTDVPVLAERLD